LHFRGAVVSVKIFLSTVSDEFRAYRDQLRSDLTRHNVEVKVQEDLKDHGGVTLDKLDIYIGVCDAVVHLIGAMTGAAAKPASTQVILAKHPDLAERLPPLREPLELGEVISYTQWEAWLALYHRKALLIAEADDDAPRGPNFAPTPASRTAQQTHLERLRAIERYPGCTFISPDQLAKHIAYTAVLDLLVKAYGEQEARARHVAEGFIHELAKRVAGDRHLDFEGMKLAVRNAIDLYEREIAGGQTQTNIDRIVDEALQRARSFVDEGKSGLARAALRKAAKEMRREEEQRRERYVDGITTLYNRTRDIALAAYDGVAAADAILTLAEAVHATNTVMIARSLNSEADTLYEYGRDRGSNVHLIALIELRRKLLDYASSSDERGSAGNRLAVALWALGERESGTARLEEAVVACRNALKEYSRERVPLDWAMTQNNLGLALWRLGERESGTARLEEAVAAYRDALKEFTRERVPLDWAATQNNLGNALWNLGERESGTARLEEAVAAYRDALTERRRDRVPLQWAMSQYHLGNALWKLGERESGTARLEEAVAAARDALVELPRERVPLDWARTQNSLGTALAALGERESGTVRLEEAVAAFRDALMERTRERVPLQWAQTQNSLGTALATLGERELTARLEEAVIAYRDALTERTRERVPLQWAQAQNNLGDVLFRLGVRESGTARLEEAVIAYRDALTERTRERVPLDWAMSLGNQGVALMRLAERLQDATMAETAFQQIETAFETMRAGGHAPNAAYYEAHLPEARRVRHAFKVR